MMKCTENGGCKFYAPSISFKAGTGPFAKDIPDHDYGFDEGCNHPDQEYVHSYICNRCSLWTPADQTDLTMFLGKEGL